MFCAVIIVCLCTGRFFMVPLNLTCLHCLQHLSVWISLHFIVLLLEIDVLNETKAIYINGICKIYKFSQQIQNEWKLLSSDSYCLNLLIALIWYAYMDQEVILGLNSCKIILIAFLRPNVVKLNLNLTTGNTTMPKRDTFVSNVHQIINTKYSRYGTLAVTIMVTVRMQL